MTLKALLLDFDGTIADTEETHRQAFNHAFVRFGLGCEWTKPQYRELLEISGGKERIGHFFDTLAVADNEKARLHRLVPALHDAKTQLYTELIGDGRCPLRPGIARLFDEAGQHRIQVAIASTSSAASIYALLAQQLGDTGARCLTAIACGDQVAKKKPAPDIYRLAMAMLGRSAGECAAFEDSINGLRAAKAAGLFTVVTPSQWTQGGDFRDADILLQHLGDRDRPFAIADAATFGARWLSLAELARRHAAAKALPIANDVRPRQT